MELKKKQEQRLKYLEVLYKKAAGTPLQGVNHYEIRTSWSFPIVCQTFLILPARRGLDPCPKP